MQVMSQRLAASRLVPLLHKVMDTDADAGASWRYFSAETFRSTARVPWLARWQPGQVWHSMASWCAMLLPLPLAAGKKKGKKKGLALSPEQTQMLVSITGCLKFLSLVSRASAQHAGPWGRVMTRAP